jgi:hypothetical protein
VPRKPQSLLFVLAVVVLGQPGYAAQSGTCEMDGGRKAHYFCPDGYELVLAGGGSEDCSGRCFRAGSAKELEVTIQGIMETYDVALSPQEAAKVGEELTSTGSTMVQTPDGDAIHIRTGKL